MIKKLLILVLLFSTLVPARLMAQEFWFEYGISWKTWNNLTTKVELQHRFIDREEMLNYKNSGELTLQYRISPMFKLSGSYRFSNQMNVTERYEKEGEIGKQRYCIDLNVRLPMKNDVFTIENRLRYQIALKNKEDVKRFYRNKLTTQIKIDKKTDFIISDEIYYYITKERFDLNRISLGLDRDLIKNISANITFHIETDREGRSLANNYIISSGLYLKF